MKEEFYKWMYENISKDGDFRLIKSITCQDRFNISVQCSAGHYCSPRMTLPVESYEAFELGFPSEKEELIMEYAEEPENPTETVYAQVPLGVVLKVIEKHGGIQW